MLIFDMTSFHSLSSSFCFFTGKSTANICISSIFFLSFSLNHSLSRSFDFNWFCMQFCYFENIQINIYVHHNYLFFYLNGSKYSVVHCILCICVYIGLSCGKTNWTNTMYSHRLKWLCKQMALRRMFSIDFSQYLSICFTLSCMAHFCHFVSFFFRLNFVHLFSNNIKNIHWFSLWTR